MLPLGKEVAPIGTKRRWFRWARLGMAAVSLPVLSLFLLSAMAARPENLGVKNGRLAPCPSSPNCVSTQAEDQRHRMEAIPFTGSRSAAIGRIKAAVATLPRMKIITETDDYLHVEATSRLFRFVDDVEFFVDQTAGLINFRSASRVGHSDFGANRKRMQKIREALTRDQQP